MLDFAPLNKQSKLLKFQIHNSVRASIVPVNHDKLKSVSLSPIYNGQIVQSSSKVIIFLQTLLSVMLNDV